MNDVYNIEPIQILEGIPVFTDLNTKYIKNYDLIAQKHLDGLEKTGENPYGNKRYTEFSNRHYLGYVNKYTKDNDFVLDAGISLGDIMFNLNTPNKYGVDISIDYLRIAKKYNIELCLAMLENLPYKDNLFDVVLCKDVLEHVFDLHTVIKNILRVLKTGGYLIFQVPYKQDLTVYLTYTEFDYVHLRNFDEASIILMFQKIFNCSCVEYGISKCTFEFNCDVIDVVIKKQ